MIHQIRKAVACLSTLGRDECSFHESRCDGCIEMVSRYMCNLVEILILVEIECASLQTGTSRRDLKTLVWFDLDQILLW